MLLENHWTRHTNWIFIYCFVTFGVHEINSVKSLIIHTLLCSFFSHHKLQISIWSIWIHSYQSEHMNARKHPARFPSQWCYYYYYYYKLNAKHLKESGNFCGSFSIEWSENNPPTININAIKIKYVFFFHGAEAGAAAARATVYFSMRHWWWYHLCYAYLLRTYSRKCVRCAT